MEITLVRVNIVNPSDSNRTADVELIVETGAVLTWIKSSRLEQIGVRPKREKQFRTIEGRRAMRSTGPVVLRYDGSEADAEVVFALESDAEVLGVTAIESMGYEVDPVTNRLHRSSLLAV